VRFCQKRLNKKKNHYFEKKAKSQNQGGLI